MSEVLVVFAALLAAIALGVPVPIAVGIATLVGTWLIDLPLIGLAQNAYNGLESTTLITVPLFVFAGVLMERGGISDRIVEISRALVGRIHGSLGVVSVVACTFFAGISGSAVADAAAIGSITIPAMIRDGYPRPFAGAVGAAGGAIGSLMPPSTLLIIYGITTSTSIPRLFLAGIVPGLITSLMLAATAWFIARRNNYGSRDESFSVSRLGASLWRGRWALGAPAIVIGGIFFGLTTVTEAAAVAVFYACFVGFLINRTLTPRDVWECLHFTAIITGSILVLLGLARAFGEVMTLMDAPTLVGAMISGATDNPLGTLMIIVGLLFVTGTFMESAAQILLLVPLFVPIVAHHHIDPVAFGLIVVLACEFGFLTPPVGVTLFVGMRLAKVSLGEISVAAIPFYLPYVIMIVLLALMPALALTLPNLAYGGGR